MTPEQTAFQLNRLLYPTNWPSDADIEAASFPQLKAWFEGLCRIEDGCRTPETPEQARKFERIVRRMCNG